MKRQIALNTGLVLLTAFSVGLTGCSRKTRPAKAADKKTQTQETPDTTAGGEKTGGKKEDEKKPELKAGEEMTKADFETRLQAIKKAFDEAKVNSVVALFVGDNGIEAERLEPLTAQSKHLGKYPTFRITNVDGRLNALYEAEVKRTAGNGSDEDSAGYVNTNENAARNLLRSAIAGVLASAEALMKDVIAGKEIKGLDAKVRETEISRLGNLISILKEPALESTIEAWHFGKAATEEPKDEEKETTETKVDPNALTSDQVGQLLEKAAEKTANVRMCIVRIEAGDEEITRSETLSLLDEEEVALFNAKKVRYEVAAGKLKAAFDLALKAAKKMGGATTDEEIKTAARAMMKLELKKLADAMKEVGAATSEKKIADLSTEEAQAESARIQMLYDFAVSAETVKQIDAL